MKYSMLVSNMCFYCRGR